MGWENATCFSSDCVTVPLSGLKADQLGPFIKGLDQADIFMIP